MSRIGLVITSLLVCTSVAWADGVAAVPSSTTVAPVSTRAKLAKTLRPSFVLVDYTLQRSNGEMPWFGHVDAGMILLKLPVTKVGLVVGDGQVVTEDLGLDRRFVKAIAVRRDVDAPTVPAEITAYGAKTSLTRLRLKAALPGARPLRPTAWRPKGKVAYAVDLTRCRGKYGVVVRDVQVGTFVFPDHHDPKPTSTRNGLLVTAMGQPVAFGRALDRGELGHPDRWATITTQTLGSARRSLEERVGHEVVRVHLTFREPLRKPKYQEFKMEWSGLGLLIPDGRVLVFADLKSSTTARLKTIRVIGSTTTPASFQVSLKRYGAFVAKLDRPMGRPAALDADATRFEDCLVIAAGVRIAGEKRTDRFNRHHLALRYVNLSRALRYEYASTVGSFFGYPGQNTQVGTFLYSRTGRLLCVPLKFRERTPYQRFSDGPVNVAHVRRLLADLKGDQVDLVNRPLTKEESQRLAWLGVELQPLTPELAREAKVLSRTRGGYTGGLVVHVYPDSPASKAKLQEGDVLTAIRSDDRPELELSIQLNSYMYTQHTRFPWKQLDRCSDAYFEHLPKPWPPVATPITRALTDLGFGKPFTVEIARDGKILQIPMTVTAGPKSFDSAARATHEALGMTVANLTYEVRRVLRRKAKAPGVVVAKIERGSKVSVAGLKPYEVVTHVNGTAIQTVADFTKAVAQGGALRFSVKRLHMGRIVKVTIPAVKATAKTTAPRKATTGTPTQPVTKPRVTKPIPAKAKAKAKAKTVATAPR